MPTLDTALVYPGACLVEGTNLSEGRGTTLPFQTVGAPFLRGNELAESLRAVHPRSFVCVPIFAYGNVVGAFTFGVSTTNRKYTQDDVELAEELAHHAGSAIEAAYR